MPLLNRHLQFVDHHGPVQGNQHRVKESQLHEDGGAKKDRQLARSQRNPFLPIPTWDGVSSFSEDSASTNINNFLETWINFTKNVVLKWTCCDFLANLFANSFD